MAAITELCAAEPSKPALRFFFPVVQFPELDGLFA